MQTRNESIEQFMQAYQSGDKAAARDHIRDALAVAVNERLDTMKAQVADDIYNKSRMTESVEQDLNEAFLLGLPKLVKKMFSLAKKDKGMEMTVKVPVELSKEDHKKIREIITDVTGAKKFDQGTDMKNSMKEYQVPVKNEKQAKQVATKVNAYMESQKK